jgi:DNA-binding transcriptional ArsR family regulator
VGDVFKALADPTRRMVLDELTERDGQAISQHVDVLESAGLVRTQREGRYKFHHLDTAPLRQIADRWSIPDPEHD